VEGDIKEVVGALMRVLGGDEISRDEVEDLEFEATDDLLAALNDAYIKLLEFSFDRDARLSDRKLDEDMRAELQQSLNNIIRLSDSSLTTDRQSTI
jgi:hypothetical protein